MSNVPELTNEQWAGLADELALRVQHLFIRRGWRKKGSFKSPRGVGVEDVVSEAITLAISGKRKWDREKCPDFGEFLNMVVWSITGHLKDGVSLEDIAELSEDDCSSVGVGGRSGPTEPPEIAISEETKDMLWGVAASDFADDPVSMKVFECIMAGIWRPRDVADLTGLSVEDVNKARKRMKRKADKWFEGRPGL